MILLIDNYDSFTWNLVQAMRTAGAEVDVVRNDAATVEGLLGRGARGIVLSPGPGRPEDAGICPKLVAANPDLPLLGVCLGHQVLGWVHGAVVGRAARLMHGKTSEIRWQPGEALFANLPNPFTATRYHSLAVHEDTVPPVLEPIAWSEEGTIMALKHRERPWWGVQFHPESVLTPSGPEMLWNFLRTCGEVPERDPEGSEDPPRRESA